MKRRPILVALALVLALIGTGAVYFYVHTADSRAVNGMKATTVLVATKQIPVGTPWSAIASGGYVSTESVPVSAAPATALTSTSANVPAANVATYSIAPGQIVVREAFGQKPAAVGVLNIPGTLQAMTISLSANADVAGYVQNGSQVAVYGVHQLQQTSLGNAQIGGTAYASKLLLPRVTVLAVSQAAPSAVNGSGTGSAGTVLVTLALTQQQAERVVLAQKVGELYLSLLTDASASSEDSGILGIGHFNAPPLYPR